MQNDVQQLRHARRRANDVERNRGTGLAGRLCATNSRDAFARRGYDRAFNHPAQVLTTKWPVLHYGDVPQVDTRTWTFDVAGLVDRPFTLTYEELLALPRKTVQCDIHCVTRWSRLDNTFEGVAVHLLLERAGVKPTRSTCLVSAEQGFTTNLPLTDLDRPDNLVAFKWNGEWLMPEHGGPARLLVPHLYF